MQPHATQVAKKTPFNRAMSYMNLDEAIEDDGVNPRAPPCKKPRRNDELVDDLEVPNGVGDQTVSCPTNGVYIPHKSSRCLYIYTQQIQQYICMYTWF